MSMENTLLKKHKSFSGIEIILIAVSALIVGVLLTAVFAAYKNLTDTTVVEIQQEDALNR